MFFNEFLGSNKNVFLEILARMPATNQTAGLFKSKYLWNGLKFEVTF